MGPTEPTRQVHWHWTPLATSLQNLKTIYAQIISNKCIQALPCIDKLGHRFKQNVPESESRQFGRLRPRLRLLARCQDSERLRLRLRHRLRTPYPKERLLCQTCIIIRVICQLAVLQFNYEVSSGIAYFCQDSFEPE